MAQTPCARWINGNMVPYTPVSAVNPGDVVVQGSWVNIAVDAIAAATLGALAAEGVFTCPKDTSTFSAGDAIYWNATGNPVVGTAGTGCMTSTASSNKLAGVVVTTVLTGDSMVLVNLNAIIKGSTTGGVMTADSITGTSSTLPVQGLQAAQGGSASLIGGTSTTSGNAGGAALVTGGIAGATGVGGAATIAGGAGGASSGTGGAASMTGGAGTAGNATGGASSVIGGAGQGGAAGGAVVGTGGVGGATGAGGAATITGGLGGATSGTGGAASLVGGAGAGTTAVGGLAKILGGASAGASGTAGGASVDAGAATGGTAAAVIISDVNAGSTYINRGPLKAIQVGLTLTALGTAQSSTPTSAQLLGGLLSQTGATGAGTVTLPTGTALSTACPRTPVVGDTFDCYFYNLGGSQTLTITGATGTTVVGTAAVGTGKMAQMKFYNSGSNTWSIYVIVSA